MLYLQKQSECAFICWAYGPVLLAETSQCFFFTKVQTFNELKIPYLCLVIIKLVLPDLRISYIILHYKMNFQSFNN